MAFAAKQIIEEYEFHTRLIHRFVDGISHGESILQLPFEHNCMNWILGHIVANRSHVLETANIAHTWQEPIRDLYHQDTPPITANSPSIQFEKLIRYLDDSVATLKSGLADVDDAWLDEPHSNYRGEKSRRAHIESFHWHEAFHLGQLEILRAFIVSKR